MDLCWMCAGIDSDSCSICGGAGTQGPGPGPGLSPRERLPSAPPPESGEEAIRSKVKKYTTRSSRLLTGDTRARLAKRRQEEEQQAFEQERLLRQQQEQERRARERQPQTMAAPRMPEPARGPSNTPYSAEASRQARAFSHFAEKAAPEASPEADGNVKVNLAPEKPKGKRSNPRADKLDAQMAAVEQLMAAEQTVFAPPPAGYNRMPFATEQLEATRKSGVDAVKPSEGFVSRTNQPPRQKKLIPQNEMARQLPSAPIASPTSGPAALSPSVAYLHLHLQQHSQAQASSQPKSFSKEASESSTSRRIALDEDAAELPSFADLGRTDERAETKFVDPLSDLLRKVSVVEPERLRPKESSAIAPVSLHFSSRPAKWRQEKHAYTRL
ncbi:unnamed protein product [Symbiodinium sp. CCMP2456]|nr:unnamed protein product [Symbiodinium sp. CCMP2456]